MASDPAGLRSSYDARPTRADLRRSAPPAQDPELARAIELAWSRLSLYRERADEERGRVEALLEQAIRARAAGRDRAECIRELATAMVGFLGGWGEAMRRAFEMERALFEALTAYRGREREKEARQEEHESDEDASPDSAPDPATEAREMAAHEAEAARQLEELKSLQQALAWFDSHSPTEPKQGPKARPKAKSKAARPRAKSRPSRAAAAGKTEALRLDPCQRRSTDGVGARRPAPRRRAQTKRE